MFRVSLGVGAEVVLEIHRDFRTLFRVGPGVEQIAVLGADQAEHEARHVEAGRAVDRAAGGLSRAVRRHVVVELKLPTMVSAFRISRERSVRLPPNFMVWRPVLRVRLSKIWKSFWLVMSGWLLFAPRLRMFWNPAASSPTSRVQVDPREADRLRRVGAVSRSASSGT